MRKKLLNTKVTVKLRKSEYKEEWYLTVEAYPVNDPSQPGKKRIVESLNRIIRTPIWDKSSVTGVTPDGEFKYRPKRDINGVILGYSVHPGNENDGKTFYSVYEKIEQLNIKVLVGDTAYKTPAIAKKMKERGIALLSTYSRPKTKDGFFRKYEFVYDEHFDCYLCPANEILSYSTTNREGYREYKSDPKICERCPYLNQCTQSQTYVKVVTRHVWQDAVDEADENRYRYDLKDLYKYRKETIERIFGLAKELHGFRYTQQFGKVQMEVKAALTYACLNLKKLAKKRWKDRPFPSLLQLLLVSFAFPFNIYEANPLLA